MWTDLIQLPAPGLRALLPWILIAAGFIAQIGGVRILRDRVRPATSSRIVTEQGLPPGEGMEAMLSLEPPIAGARVPTDPALLPGARRKYRGGEHEGVDFSCRPGTPVVAAADGWVMSIDDEPNLPESRRNELLRYCTQLGETPLEVLSVLHGRRVTLCHGIYEGRLLTTSYSHLGSIGPDLGPGLRVRKGDLIGVAGSSGTSHAYRADGWGELHFEIHLNGVPLGAGMPPQAAGQQYRDLLGSGVAQ